MVAFPAAATVLTSPASYDPSKGRYRLLYFFQALLAIVGWLSLPTLARRFGLK